MFFLVNKFFYLLVVKNFKWFLNKDSLMKNNDVKFKF